MKLMWFHLMPYTELPEDFKTKHPSVWVDIHSSLFDPKRAHLMYNDFMDELEYAADLGYDAICVNEHHSNGYGLMPSPNLIASSLARRTSDATICVMGNSIALYNPPTRVAEEFAMLDVISGGRTRLAVCSGGGAGPAWRAEAEAMGVPAAERRKRMIENIAVLRHLWTRDGEPFAGEFTRFSGVTLLPKPAQSPCPIWLTTNAGRLGNGQADAGGSPFALRRVGLVADGWMTHSVSPDGFRASLDLILESGHATGRDMGGFDNVLCALVNINPDREAALADAKRYLDLYYGATYTRARLEAWGAFGSPAECAAWIRRYVGSGCARITFRLATMGDAAAQFRLLTQAVLPVAFVR